MSQVLPQLLPTNLTLVLAKKDLVDVLDKTQPQ